MWAPGRPKGRCMNNVKADTGQVDHAERRQIEPTRVSQLITGCGMCSVPYMTVEHYPQTAGYEYVFTFIIFYFSV